MTMWETFAAENVAVASVVGALNEALAPEGVRRPIPRDAARYLVRDEAVFAAITDDYSPPAGTYGTGVVWGRRGAPLPALFVVPALAPDGPTRIESNDWVYNLLGETLGVQLDPELLVVPLAPPVPYSISPGDAINVGMEIGLAGAIVEYDNRLGFLTAGHVAPNPGMLVRDINGGALGDVQVTSSPLAQPPGIPVADVAFVAPWGRVTTRSTIGTAQVGDPVQFRGRSGWKTAWMRGLCPNYLYSQTCAGWGDVAFTSQAVSHSGDSGGPVTNREGEVVGHIVGGVSGVYDIFQDIDYQLRWLHSR